MSEADLKTVIRELKNIIKEALAILKNSERSKG